MEWNKEIKKDLNSLIFMMENPRYSFSDASFKFKNVADEVQDLNKSIINLVDSEDDLSKLLNLVENFNKKGFDRLEDTFPFAIKSNVEEGKYIIIEGNRRLLAMRLLAKDSKTIEIFKKTKYNTLPELNKISTNDSFEEMTNFEKNKSLILNIIENTNSGKLKMEDQIPLNYFSIESIKNTEYDKIEKEIISKIVARHSYSESSLKKEWSRTKMFFELRTRFISILSIEIENNPYKTALDNTYESLKEIYKRKIETIKSDVFMSFYIYNIVNTWAEDRGTNRDKIIKKIKSSSLELSLSKIRNTDKTTLRRYLEIGKIDTEEKPVITPGFNLLQINKQNITWKELSNFIMYAYLNDYLNTRRFTICKGNGVQDDELIKLYRSIFKVTDKNVRETLTCDNDFSEKYQEEYYNLSKDNKDIQEILSLNLDYKSELSSVNKRKIYEGIIEKSEEIFEKVVSSKAKSKNSDILVLTDAIVRKKIKSNFSEHNKDSELIKNFKSIDKNVLRNSIIKKTAYLSIKKVIEFDLNNIILNQPGSISNINALMNLTSLNRSLLEMTFVLSGYFHMDKYKKDLAAFNVVVNPKDIFGYKFHKIKKYWILDFSSNSPFHSFSKMVRKFNSFKALSGGVLPEAIEKTELINVYDFNLKHNVLMNKLIHRYWSIPSRDVIGRTNFYNEFTSIPRYIDDTISIIIKQLNIHVEWIKNSNLILEDPIITQ